MVAPRTAEKNEADQIDVYRKDKDMAKMGAPHLISIIFFVPDQG